MLLSATSWIWKITCFWFLSPPLPQYQILTWSPKPLQSLWRRSSVGRGEACPVLHMPIGKTLWWFTFTCSTCTSNVFYRLYVHGYLTLLSGPPHFLNACLCVLSGQVTPHHLQKNDSGYPRRKLTLRSGKYYNSLLRYEPWTLFLFELFQATSHAVSEHQRGHQPNVKSRRVRSELQVSYNNQYYFQAYHINF